MPRRNPMTPAEKAAAGLCTMCGKQPPAPNRKSCTPCLTHARENCRALSAKRKAQGLCITCGKQPPRPERVQCADCAAIAKARYDQRNGNEGLKKRYRARVSAGLCTKCGKVEAAPNRRLCVGCGVKVRTAEQERKARRRSQGLCIDCAAPAQGGYQTCNACREKQARYAAKSQAVPVWEPRYAVFVLETDECLGTFDSREDVALCLAFAKLDREDVEIVTDAPALAGLVGRT